MLVFAADEEGERGAAVHSGGGGLPAYLYSTGDRDGDEEERDPLWIGA